MYSGMSGQVPTVQYSTLRIGAQFTGKDIKARCFKYAVKLWTSALTVPNAVLFFPTTLTREIYHNKVIDYSFYLLFLQYKF